MDDHEAIGTWIIALASVVVMLWIVWVIDRDRGGM